MLQRPYSVTLLDPCRTALSEGPWLYSPYNFFSRERHSKSVVGCQPGQSDQLDASSQLVAPEGESLLPSLCSGAPDFPVFCSSHSGHSCQADAGDGNLSPIKVRAGTDVSPNNSLGGLTHSTASIRRPTTKPSKSSPATAMPIDGDGPFRSFSGISLAGQSGGTGTLKLTQKGFAWKARDSNRNVALAAMDLQRLEWLRGGRGMQLKLTMKAGSTLRFEGFRNSEFPDLKAFALETFGKELSVVPQACRGWSWGELDVSRGAASNLIFRTGGGTSAKHKAVDFEDAFEMPMGKVANVALPGNGKELALDFHVDDTAGKMDEELVEMRFFIPDEKQAEDVCAKVKARADTSAFAGESMCSFMQMGVAVPRGRYDVDMYANYIKLRGKAVDFKILYSSITRLFLLPKPDNVLVSFVMSLDPPIRQGNTMYPHLVFQFDTEEKTRVDLPIPEKELQEKYKGKLSETEEGYTWRVFSKVLKNLSSTPLHVPKTFKSSEEASGVRTALGANEGFLFFLESCCFFINKPPSYIRYDDIDFVEFRRMDLERRFDLFMSLTTGSSATFLFTNIERSEFEPIFNFLYEAKKVPVENAEQLKRTGGRQRVTLADDDDSSESEDDDFDPHAQPKASAGAGDDSDSEGSDAEMEEPDADEIAHLKGSPKRPKKKAKTSAR